MMLIFYNKFSVKVMKPAEVGRTMFHYIVWDIGA